MVNNNEQEPDERQLVGYVAVDSGQVMVCDPTYIESEWQGNELSAEFMTRRYLDTVTKKTYSYPTDFGRFSWVFDESTSQFREKSLDTETLDPVPEDVGLLTVNDLVASGRFVQDTAEANNKAGEFSYEGCCVATCSDAQSGQMYFKLGNEGAGVATSSGLGDGVYPAYIHKENVGGWGERVVRLEVVFIEEEVTDGERND